jgi:hypothetical protein
VKMTWTNPSYRKHGLRYFESRDPEDIAILAEVLRVDMAACETCQKGTPVLHSNATVRGDWAVTYQCRSLSRWFNPTTKKMEGRAHCTCDGCW